MTRIDPIRGPGGPGPSDAVPGVQPSRRRPPRDAAEERERRRRPDDRPEPPPPDEPDDGLPHLDLRA